MKRIFFFLRVKDKQYVVAFNQLLLLCGLFVSLAFNHMHMRDSKRLTQGFDLSFLSFLKGFSFFGNTRNDNG